jgi:cytochrome c2
MKKYLLIIGVILLAACKSTKLLTPSQSDVDRVSSRYPGYTLAELNHGKAIFTQYCGQCHKLKKPESRTEEQWKTIVPRMVAKVNKKEKDAIDADEEEVLLKYLVTMSTAKNGGG